MFNSYGNVIPIRQGYNMVDISPQPTNQSSNQQPKDKNPPSNVYHINLDPPNQQQQQQPPPQQQAQVMSQQTHKSMAQSQITMEKLNERGPPPGSGYHIELKHDDRKDIVRGIGPSSQPPNQPHISEGHVYNTTVRHHQIHTSVLPIQQPQGQQPNKPSGSITQGYAHRLPNAPPPQQPQPGQIHYPRHRY